MPFYDDVKKAINKTKDNVAQKTGNYTEMSKLNASISEQEREIRTLYGKAGEICYQKYIDDPAHVDSDLQPLCQQISGLIQKREESCIRLLHLKGLRRCEFCGKEIPENVSFCNFCGGKQTPVKIPADEGKKVCPECGTPFEEHQMFCMNCGHDLRFVPEPVKKVCSHCGSELEEDAAFCMNCGHPVSDGSAQ